MITVEAFNNRARETAKRVVNNPKSAEKFSKWLADEAWGRIDPLEPLYLDPERRARYIHSLEIGVLSCKAAVDYKEQHASPHAVAVSKERHAQLLVDYAWQKIYAGEGDAGIDAQLQGVGEITKHRHIVDKNLYMLGLAAEIGRGVIALRNHQSHEEVIRPIAKKCIDETEHCFNEYPQTMGQKDTAATLMYLSARMVDWYLDRGELSYIRPSITRERGTKPGAFELVEETLNGITSPLRVNSKISTKWKSSRVRVLYPYDGVWGTLVVSGLIGGLRDVIRPAANASTQREKMKALHHEMGFALTSRRAPNKKL